MELYNYLAAVLGQSQAIITKLKNYQAVGGVIAKVRRTRRDARLLLVAVAVAHRSCKHA